MHKCIFPMSCLYLRVAVAEIPFFLVHLPNTLGATTASAGRGMVSGCGPTKDLFAAVLLLLQVAGRARGGGGAEERPEVRVGGASDAMFFSICGTLHSVDQYLNVKLVEISVQDPERHPHMLSVKNCFIRGSVVRYIHLPAESVDTNLLQESTRKEILQSRQQQQQAR